MSQTVRNAIFFTGDSSTSSQFSSLGITNDDGTGSAIFGQGAGAVNKGNDNVFAGTNSGADNVSGSRNIAVGSNALQTTTAASDIIAVGYDSLNALPSASYSLAIGNYTASNAVRLEQVIAEGYASLQKCVE